MSVHSISKAVPIKSSQADDVALVHQITDLKRLFDDTFASDFNTRLIKGDDEPIYLPANTGEGKLPAQPFAQVVFAHGFYASALHEIAHWCLAGEQRRTQVDYGYWYCPDGRTAEEQQKFQSVEIKPQAIEWALSLAAGFRFQVSCDNLSGDEFGQQPDRLAFEKQILDQIKVYLDNGYPPRAQLFIECLAAFYNQSPFDELKRLVT
ncbi:elongation factor P hydroxylase [Psychrosphaera haliotis]|uniref:elongation factor P hydroxylase n=1 Tax=Psychrosphaera haliotis TaxID=555083 RepID=UPI002ED85C8C